MEYRRHYQPGGWYFFTVVTYQRQPILTQPGNIACLRRAFRRVRKKRPFSIAAITILPDHLHTILKLPGIDSDFSTRWQMIKHDYSAAISTNTTARPLTRKREQGIWQHRFWEHTIRDESDLRLHMDYVHYNAVKHGYVTRPSAWPYCSFIHAVNKGWYPENWGQQEPETLRDLWYE